MVKCRTNLDEFCSFLVFTLEQVWVLVHFYPSVWIQFKVLLNPTNGFHHLIWDVIEAGVRVLWSPKWTLSPRPGRAWSLLAAFLLQAILLLFLRTSRERKKERKEGTRPPTPQSKLRISSLHDAGKATQSLTLPSSRNRVFPQFSVSRGSTRRENSFS